MKAMILAAGSGTRLRPLTARIPKCMIPIGGKPILERTIEHLRRYGVTELVINVCTLPQVIMDTFGDGERWGVHIVYSVEERPLGTAGGVKRAARFFDQAPFVVWYGDNLSRCDLDRLIGYHHAKGGLATIALFERESVSQSGIVGLDEDDRIQRFLEKPRPDQIFSHWVNAGILILEPNVLDLIPSGRLDFSLDIFPALLAARHRLYGYRLSNAEGLWWVDTPADLARVQAEWQDLEETP
jgi:NDP-sugar pyrophosphorylase family protein